MKLSLKSVNKFFQNKIVLYVILGLSLFNLLGYLSNNNLTGIIIFLLIGYSTTFYTKNMSYILLAPLILTNMIVYIFNSFILRYKEGMIDKSHNENNDNENNDNNENNNNNKNNPKKKDKKSNPKEEQIPKGHGESKSKNSQSKHKGSKLTEEGFEVDEDDMDIDDDETIEELELKNQDTMEKAYNSLEKIIGGDGVKNMSIDTENLLKNQEGLGKALDRIEPMIDKVGGLLGKLDSFGLSKFTKLK